MYRARIGKRAWAAVVAGAIAAAAAGLGGTGCSIRTQGPIKEVAYDFSDRDFYDRAYAPSPKYLETDEFYGEQPLRTRAAAEPHPAEAAPTAIAGPMVMPVPGAAAVVLPLSAPASPTPDQPATTAPRAANQPTVAPLPHGLVVDRSRGH